MSIPKFFKVKINQQLYEVEIVDPLAHPVLAVVNGTPIEVWPETGEALPLAGQAQSASPAAATGQPAAQDGQVMAILAPIPGVITAVSVKAGQAVSYGQEICVLEAMKMKNVIRAPRLGTIGQVLISPGQSVKHHDVLVEYQE